jgi:hypothetical protein
MKAYLLLLALASLWVGAYGCPPPTPPNPPPGTGGSSGTGGSVVVDAAPPPPPSCRNPQGECCKTCTVLAAHSCPEGRPTMLGMQCESVCDNAATGPLEMRWPNIGACADLDCVRQRFECSGGH